MAKERKYKTIRIDMKKMSGDARRETRAKTLEVLTDIRENHRSLWAEFVDMVLKTDGRVVKTDIASDLAIMLSHAECFGYLDEGKAERLREYLTEERRKVLKATSTNAKKRVRRRSKKKGFGVAAYRPFNMAPWNAVSSYRRSKKKRTR